LNRIVNHSFSISLSESDEGTLSFIKEKGYEGKLITISIKAGEVIRDLHVIDRENVYFNFRLNDEKENKVYVVRASSTLEIIKFCTEQIGSD
jgi:hypothetical protein